MTDEQRSIDGSELLDRLAGSLPQDVAAVRQRQRDRGELGTQMFLARQLAGLTQVQLAERSGVAQSDISLIENGRGNPRYETIRRLSDALEFQFRIGQRASIAA